ncbi:unnamed protein product [Pleuronectes platessa]|uniref:Uncharacterized protein n=1 Tax=Pleuronectes platessa TaxID=8262 RepID=A0A9N7TJB4_PLEPL|nr:unnamed protein product [Pleuronectes platessa]
MFPRADGGTSLSGPVTGSECPGASLCPPPCPPLPFFLCSFSDPKSQLTPVHGQPLLANIKAPLVPNLRCQSTYSLSACSMITADSSEGLTPQPSVMTEHAPSSAVTVSSSTSIPAATSTLIPPSSSSTSSSSSSTAIPQPNSNSKPWRSKSMSSKHSSSTSLSSTSTPASAMQSVKQEKDTSCKTAAATEAPPKAVAQRSMLEKLKLFNSKGSSKSSTSSNGVGAQTDNSAPARQLGAGQVETGSNTDLLGQDEGNVRPGMNGTSNGAVQEQLSPQLPAAPKSP